MLRLALPVVAGVLVLATLVVAAIRWLPESKLFQRPESDAVRLAWLLDQLGDLSADQETAASLLQAYHQQFDGEPAVMTTTPPPDATFPAAATPLPSPSPQPTATPQPTTDTIPDARTGPDGRSGCRGPGAGSGDNRAGQPGIGGRRPGPGRHRPG